MVATYTKEDLIIAVEANVEDFFLDEEVEDIVTMSVEDALNANAVPAPQQNQLWDELAEIANAKYQELVERE